jgi:hypothetical protein
LRSGERPVENLEEVDRKGELIGKGQGTFDAFMCDNSLGKSVAFSFPQSRSLFGALSSAVFSIKSQARQLIQAEGRSSRVHGNVADSVANIRKGSLQPLRGQRLWDNKAGTTRVSFPLSMSSPGRSSRVTVVSGARCLKVLLLSFLLYSIETFLHREVHKTWRALYYMTRTTGQLSKPSQNPQNTRSQSKTRSRFSTSTCYQMGASIRRRTERGQSVCRVRQSLVCE